MNEYAKKANEMNSDEILAECASLCQKGMIIRAIKLYRYKFGTSLQKARHAVTGAAIAKSTGKRQ